MVPDIAISQDESFRSHQNLGLDLVYRRNPATGVTIVAAGGGRAEIHTSNGQSLDQGGGARTAENITVSCPYPGLIFTLNDRYGTRGSRFKGANLDGLQLVPAVETHRPIGGETSGQGETPVTQTMAALQRDRAAHGEAIVPMGGRSHAFAGARLADIREGTVPYENSKKIVARFSELFAAEGYASIVPSIAMNHGETDRAIRTSYDDYCSGAESLLDAYNRDHKPITGQSEDIFMVWTQLAARVDHVRNGDVSPIGQAQVDLCARNPLMSMAAPRYIFPHEFNPITGTYDPLHQSAIGTKLMAEYIARAKAWIRRHGVKFPHLHIAKEDVELNGRRVTMKVRGGAGALREFSDGWLPLHPTRGFTVGSDARRAKIVDVGIVKARCIELTLSAPPTGTNLYVTAGYNEAPGHAAPGMPSSYTNICDSEPGMSHTLPDRPLPNFLCSTRIPI